MIDDVGIQLRNDSSAVGIQIGDNQFNGTQVDADLYSLFIKANVWIGSEGGTGLKIMNGEVRYSLVNLTVTGPSNGIRVDLSNEKTNRSIYHNQFSTFDNSDPNHADKVVNPGFMLSTGGINNTVLPTSALVINNPNNPDCDINVQPF